ncbi:MAG: glycoside hydrolase domain-containing protein [Victivallaceae bacterium]
MNFRSKTISSLEKVFCDEALCAEEMDKATALCGEVYSFQVACWCDSKIDAEIEVVSELHELITIRKVEYVPSLLPAGISVPGQVLRTTPGLYPDPLCKIVSKVRILQQQWQALWVTVSIPENFPAGNYPVEIRFKHDGELVAEALKLNAAEVFELKILPLSLPPQKLIHTQWFHTDCIYTYYNVPCWSEKHWELIEKYIASAVEHGINMILTPLWTPPLDTAVGGERPTVQLLKIEKHGEQYRFDFTLLERWIEICLRRGVEYLEMAHFFTQWGSKFTPKIIVSENGEEKKLFGWHVAAESAEYKKFLTQLIPALTGLLERKGLKDKCFFHVSDEPNIDNIENYRQAATLIEQLLGKGWSIIDALSNIAFYNSGIVKMPIPSSNHIENFVENNVKPLWTYYCISQQELVSNRFLNFSSARNRIMGILMYKYDIAGFLHWGFNFWYSQYSIDQKLDPYKDPEAGRGFCAGDAFMVYPGEDGPVDSIHYEVFREALQDLRALRLLESAIGRDAVIGMLEENLDRELKMADYPSEASWLLKMREQINLKLSEVL